MTHDQHVGAHPHVLVVDDDHDLVEILQFMLTRAGFEVRAAYDASNALDVWRRWSPDIILLDAVMPGMDANMGRIRLTAKSWSSVSLRVSLEKTRLPTGTLPADWASPIASLN